MFPFLCRGGSVPCIGYMLIIAIQGTRYSAGLSLTLILKLALTLNQILTLKPDHNLTLRDLMLA